MMDPTIADILKRIETHKTALGITLYKGASPAEIGAFEMHQGVKLSADLREFYSYCNGFESEEDLFRIVPLDEIFERGPDENLLSLRDFHFAEYMIYCDMWTISIDSQDNNKYSIYKKGDALVNFTNSFSLFLEKFLDGGVFDGLYQWEKEINGKVT